MKPAKPTGREKIGTLSQPDPHRAEKLARFDELLTLMNELRENCPWDRKQTTASLRHLSIEEVFELSDAILNEDADEVKGELGDLLLHIVFYARLGEEKGDYDIASLMDQLIEKLVRRHPHIYADIDADDEEAVKANWERIKLEEKKGKTENKGVLSGVPRSLPPLVKAQRMQDKARGVGFDWPDRQGVWDKVQEELGELQAEVAAGASPERVAEEFGDVLFSLINYGRFIGVQPDEALERTNRKFKARFEHMEAAAEAQGTRLQDLSLPQMEALWQAAKD